VIEEMRIWYDACTGKHIRYGVAVARRLRSLGHEVTLTTRDHPDTIPLARFLKEQILVVGKYDPKFLASRLRESLKRQLRLLEMFEKNPPDYGVSHGSIDLCRVAFGLAVPSISTADSPHATAANKLGLPLVNHLVISKAFPKRLYQKYGVQNIIQFEGVDEVAWVSGYRPVKLEYEKPLIVVRQAETKAAYAQGKRDITLEIAQKLTKLGTVVFIPRYQRRKQKGMIIPQGFVDTISLAAHADLVVGVGGTLAREAALQGTPSLVIQLFGRSHTNDYLAEKGFPIVTSTAQRALFNAEKHLGAKKNVKDLLKALENPLGTIEKLIEGENVHHSAHS
jgi:predicted glycosyltransferase